MLSVKVTATHAFHLEWPTLWVSGRISASMQRGYHAKPGPGIFFVGRGKGRQQIYALYTHWLPVLGLSTDHVVCHRPNKLLSWCIWGAYLRGVYIWEVYTAERSVHVCTPYIWEPYTAERYSTCERPFRPRLCFSLPGTGQVLPFFTEKWDFRHSPGLGKGTGFC